MKAEIKPRIELENRTKLEEVIPLETPFLIFLDPSDLCNFKCKFCPTGNKALISSLNAHNEKDKEAAKNGIRKLYESSQFWNSRTRGTARHYHYFFPEDKILKCWSDLSCIECN